MPDSMQGFDPTAPAVGAMLAVLEQFPVMLFRISPDGTIHSHSSGGTTGIWRRPNESKGTNVLAMFADSPTITNALSRALGGESLNVSGTFGHRYFNVRFEPEYRDNVLVAVVGSAFDVTDLIETQTALARSEERYRMLVETAAEGIVIVDRSYGVEFVNRRFAAMLGYAPEDLIGSDVLDVVDPTMHDSIRQRRAGRKPDDVEQFEVRYVHNDGHIVPALISSRVFGDGSGAAAGVVGMVSDISERVEIERQQLRLQQALVNAETTEQRRLARALHDGPIQQLAAVNLQLGAVRRRNHDRALADDINAVEDKISETLRSLRLMMFDLEPADAADTLGAIRSCANVLFSGTTDVVLVDGELPALDPIVANTLYRIAREALTNVRKHAHASEVAIHVGQRAGGIAMSIKDDGVGAPTGPPQPSPLGYGIRSMVERGREIGGVVSVEGIEPHGTAVYAWLPATPQARPPDQVDCC